MLPTYISCVKEAVPEEVIAVVRSTDSIYCNAHPEREFYYVITKPTLSDILLDRVDDKHYIADKGSFGYSKRSIKEFILGLINEEPEYQQLLEDIRMNAEDNQKFRQYKNGSLIEDHRIGNAVHYTILDMLLLVKSMNRITPEVLAYMLEIEYGVKSVEIVEFLNLTSKK